jgi:hypothetical protein
MIHDVVLKSGLLVALGSVIRPRPTGFRSRVIGPLLCCPPPSGSTPKFTQPIGV